MKRVFGSLLLMAVAAVTLAQAPFTIVRPADGSKVRETVRVLFPKMSVPEGGYVGIFLNGKFVEAIVPRTGQTYMEYTLDTKARSIPDGPLNIEAVLYVDFQEKPRIVDRTSVQVTVANSSSITIPQNGFLLRYNFSPGTQWTYMLDNRVAVSTISEASARRGGRAANLPLDAESLRLQYVVENAYGNGDALVRMQPLADKGKESVILTLSNDPQPKRYYDYQMAPVYMRVDNRGIEQFGSIPTYFPMLGTAGATDARLDLYAVFPLPTLPPERVKPGATWAGRFQMGELDLDKRFELTKLTSRVPARGEFVGVEWEMGHPCAKIRHTFSVGEGRPNPDQKDKIRSNAQSIEEDIWFALDKRVVLKMVRTMVLDQQVAGNLGLGTGGGSGSGGGSAGGGTRSGGGQRGGRGGAAPGGGAGDGVGSPDDRSNVPIRQGGPMGMGAGDPSTGQRGGQSRRGGASGTPGAGSGGGDGQRVRVTVQQVFTLEK